MESPFNDRVVGPISDYNVPDEYIHHLPFKGTLPDPFENMSKMATDLVRVLELGAFINYVDPYTHCLSTWFWHGVRSFSK